MVGCRSELEQRLLSTTAEVRGLRLLGASPLQGVFALTSAQTGAMGLPLSSIHGRSKKKLPVACRMAGALVSSPNWSFVIQADGLL